MRLVAERKKTASQFLATHERVNTSREASINIGRRLKRDEVTEGVCKNDRISIRKKANLSVKIGLSRSRFWISGTIRDVSKTGAKITLQSGLLVSRTILIYNEETGDIIPANVVRNTIDSIGVEFAGKRSKVFPNTSKFFAEINLETARKMVAKQNATKAKPTARTVQNRTPSRNARPAMARR